MLSPSSSDKESWIQYPESGMHSMNFSLRKHSFLLALRRWGRFARRNVCDPATEIPYWWRKSVRNPVRSADWSMEQLHSFSYCLRMTDKGQKATKVKCKRDESVAKRSIFVEFEHFSFAGARSQMNTTLVPVTSTKSSDRPRVVPKKRGNEDVRTILRKPSFKTQLV